MARGAVSRPGRSARAGTVAVPTQLTRSWAEELPGFSGREFHASELTFSLGQAQQQRLPHVSRSSATSNSQAPSPWDPRPFVQRIQQSAMAAITLQAGTLTLAAVGVAPAVAAEGFAARRAAAGGHTGTQLWLQEQLSRVPFFRPLAMQLSAAGASAAAVASSSAAATAAAASTAGSNTGAVQSPATTSGPSAKGGRAPKQIPLVQPKNLSPEDKQLWDMFVEMDVNGDGHIDEPELLSALVKLGLPCSPSYVEQMMRQFQMSSSGTNEGCPQRRRIIWEEFRRYVHKREDQINAAFREFDRDGDGVITAWEVGQALVKAGLPTTGRDIRKVMEVLGKDVTDSISYQEFRKFATFMPSWQVKNMEVHSYAGWLWTAPVVTAAATRRRPNIISDPLQHFMAFDLLMRTCMAGSLALMVVMAIKMD